MISEIGLSSDNLVRLDSLTNSSTGAFINTATVTFTLFDSTGTAVAGATSVTMPFVAGSNGRYEGSITNAVSAGLTLNAQYRIDITATSGAIQLFRRISAVAKFRAAL
jgi:hypothetical protein